MNPPFQLITPIQFSFEILNNAYIKQADEPPLFQVYITCIPVYWISLIAMYTPMHIYIGGRFHIVTDS